MSWPSFEQLLWQIQAELGAIRAMLQQNREEYTQRLDRIEDRLNADKIKVSDLLPLAGGCLIIGLTLWGKPELAAAVASLFGR